MIEPLLTMAVTPGTDVPCRVCGRTLTASAADGIGPVCAAKFHLPRPRGRRNAAPDQLTIPTTKEPAPMPRKPKTPDPIVDAIRAFPFWDYGMDDVDPEDENAEWVPALATKIREALATEQQPTTTEA